MVMVKSFRGLRYNPEKVGSLDSALAPPYDVISPRERDELYEKNPYNVVRVILAKGSNDGKYEAAGRAFSEWIKGGVLIEEDVPSIYPFYQQFDDAGDGGKGITRKGFIAVLKIEDFESKLVLPHEKTFAKPKEDRLKLTKACNANLSPVFTVYSDPEGGLEGSIDDAISSLDPVIDVSGEDGVVSRLWRVSDPGVLDTITTSLAERTLLIADGHHRYETAVNFRDIKRAESGGADAGEAEYVMVFLARAEGEGLVIKPTHRVVKSLGPLTVEELLDRVESRFAISRIPIDRAEDSMGHEEFCIYTRGGDFLYKLSPKYLEGEPFESIAVFKLHKQLLGTHVSDDEGSVAYTKSFSEALDMVKSGEYEAAFLLPNLRAMDILSVVSAGEKMPHKSTYFYPKILSGLVFHRLG